MSLWVSFISFVVTTDLSTLFTWFQCDCNSLPDSYAIISMNSQSPQTTLYIWKPSFNPSFLKLYLAYFQNITSLCSSVKEKDFILLRVPGKVIFIQSIRDIPSPNFPVIFFPTLSFLSTHYTSILFKAHYAYLCTKEWENFRLHSKFDTYHVIYLFQTFSSSV